MPRSQGTSRKGKPGKHDRASGMGKALQKPHRNKYRPRMDGKNIAGDGGMGQTPGVESIGMGNEDGGIHTRSVLQVNDLDDFLHQAEMAGTEFVSEREGVVVLDETAGAYTSTMAAGTVYGGKTSATGAGQNSDFQFRELSVPRRPDWDETTTKQQLETAERLSFLEWRRGIAGQEERLAATHSTHDSNTAVTPFEKNIEVWRQLWRVLERSGVVLQLVDARNPLFYLSHDLRDYAQSLGKPMMVIVNKSDYLTRTQRSAWRDYLRNAGWDHVVFFSAVVEQQKLDDEAHRIRKEQQQYEHEVKTADNHDSVDDDDDESESVSSESESKDEEDEDREASKQDLVDTENTDLVDTQETRDLETTNEPSSSKDGVDVLLTREELLDAMEAFAKKHGCAPDPRFDNRIQYGMVGFPNVGKSSVINVLVASSKHTHGVVRVGVASQPGKTKHFQTLLLPDNESMMLCDCPGLVFPSFVSQTADLIAAGVFPIAQMRDHWPVTNLICQRIPREILNAVYGMQLPVPTQQERRERGLDGVPPPTADELLTTYCIARNMMAASSGVPDYQRAARFIIKDYATGKLLFCHPPPNLVDLDAFASETVVTALNTTSKLRAKLEQQQQQTGKTEARNIKDSDGNDEDASEVDEDLLAMIGESAPSQKPDRSRPGKATKKGKNRKQKKNRKADPYGCHSTPDAALYDIAGSGGIVVKAGKYTKSGYTRPTTYPTEASR